jgi:SAM-dependent methyltransferase
MTGSPDIRDEYNQQGARADLHHLKDFAKWSYISAEDWALSARRAADFAGIVDGDTVFEAGCGSGAFLAELVAYRRVTVAGADFAENLIAIAQQHLQGDFRVADISDLSMFESNHYDRVLSQGVFLYLPTHDVARKALLEMVRLAKPGGTIYIGLINDPHRKADYEFPPSGQFFLTRDDFRGWAEELGLAIEIVDQDQIFSSDAQYDMYSRVRYSLRLRKP